MQAKMFSMDTEMIVSTFVSYFHSLVRIPWGQTNVQHVRVTGKKSAGAVLMYIMAYQMSEIFAIRKRVLNDVNYKYKWS